jgi:hypothetical protein
VCDNAATDSGLVERVLTLFSNYAGATAFPVATAAMNIDSAAGRNAEEQVHRRKGGARAGAMTRSLLSDSLDVRRVTLQPGCRVCLPTS